MVSKTNKIATIFLEEYGLKEELDGIMKLIVYSNYGLTRYIDGEVITNSEWRKRNIRALEIMEFVLEKARKTTLRKEKKKTKNLEIVKQWYLEAK